MRTWLFHGLTLGQVGEGELVGRLFAHYPSRESASADLVFEVHSRTRPLDVALESTTRPTFTLGEVKAHAQPDGRFVVSDGFTRFESSADGRKVDVDRLLEDPREPQFVVERTLLACLMMALRHHRLFVLHAAGVVDDRGRSTLVVGHGGAGKSTTAITLLEAGYRFLGDDILVLRSDPSACVSGLIKNFHAGERTLAGFPRLRTLLEPPYRAFSDKRAFDPHRAWPTARVDEARPPSTILFPLVSDEPSVATRPLSKAEAFARLVESSASLAADGAVEQPLHLALLRRFVNGARCLELSLGRDLFADPSRLLDVLSSSQGTSS